MDTRDTLSGSLEIGAFSSPVNTGVPVEIVEAENQTVEAVLSTDNDRQNVSAESMDIGVDSGANLDSSRLSTVSNSMGVGSELPGIGRTSAVVNMDVGSGLVSSSGIGVDATQLSETVEASSGGLATSTQLSTSSIGVDTAQLSGNMGVSDTLAAQVQEVDDSIEQLRRVSQEAIDHLRLGSSPALEINADSIRFPPVQTSIPENLHMVQPHHSTPGGTTSTSRRSRQVLGNISYGDLDMSGAIDSGVDPSLTVNSSMGGSAGAMDSTAVLNEPGSPSSPESNFDSSEFLNTSVLQQDEVTQRLAQSGPIGVAAAAAIMTSRKRKRSHTFESNPALRKRHCSKLVRKLKETIEELATRVGLQAVVVTYRPGKQDPREEPSFKVFGAAPLNNAVRNQKDSIIGEMDAALHQQAPPPRSQESSLHDLPTLVFDGIPTPVHKMTQAQLRAFIPTMLKFSTGRGKPGWGKGDMKPPWWPEEAPWANVRSDSRTEEQKKQLSWTDALRRIVISCYIHHCRLDLLPEFSLEHLQHTLSPEVAGQLQVQLERLQHQTTPQSSGSTVALAEVASSQPQELMGSENQQVFTVDTGMGNCDTSGMPTLADASLAEAAAKLQQVADESGEVQYATHTVTVTDRDAKALGQPVGSTTTVLLTAYPGGHSGAMGSSDGGQQFLSQTSTSTNVPNVQVVYSAAHIDSIPDSIVSSMSTADGGQTENFGTDTNTKRGDGTNQAIGVSIGTEYLNPAGQGIVMATSSQEGSSRSTEETSQADLAAELISQYTGAEPSEFQATELNSDSKTTTATAADEQQNSIGTSMDTLPASSS